MNNTKIILFAIIAIALIGGGVYLTSTEDAPKNSNMDAQLSDIKEANSKNQNEDMKGIHIMGDGTVMLGDGSILDDASVTDDGMIELSDGRIVEPEVDMRNGGDMEEEMHREIMKEGMEDSHE